MHPAFASGQLHGNVVFNFNNHPVGDLTTFALGYRNAAEILAARMAEGNGYADYDGYPILFLYRHALELYMKAIVYRGAALLGLISEARLNVNELFERHDLSRLLPSIRAIFAQLNGNYEGSGFESREDFEGFVRDFDSIDSGSYAFRYPIDRRGQPLLPNHFVINVLEFARRMGALLRFLEGVYSGIEENWQAEAEVRHELQEWAAEIGGE